MCLHDVEYRNDNQINIPIPVVIHSEMDICYVMNIDTLEITTDADHVNRKMNKAYRII